MYSFIIHVYVYILFFLVDYKYNSCASEFADKCNSGQNIYVEGHLFSEGPSFECWKESVEQISIYHHCGSNKISLAPLCEWAGENAPGYCEMEHVKVFQDLLVQANRCVLGNQGANECEEMEQCKWDQSLRCIPNDHSDDLNSIEQSEIRVELMREWEESCDAFDARRLYARRLYGRRLYGRRLSY